MTISKESAGIIKSQQARLGTETQTVLFPTKNIDQLVGAFEAIGFKALEKNADTEWGAYRAPQVLIVLDRRVHVAKGKDFTQRVTVFEKDNGKVSANCDVLALMKEAGFEAA